MAEATARVTFGTDVRALRAALAADIRPLLDAGAISTEVNRELWAEVHRTAREAAAALESGTEPVLGAEEWLAYAERGERHPYERPYFARRRRLIALGLAAIAGDETYLAALEQVLLLVCAEPTWALPAHVTDPTTMDHPDTVDLFAAETGQTLAEIVALLGDRLSRCVAARVGSEVTGRILDPMLPGTHARWWESAPMNWAAVCGGSVLMAALHLERDEDRRAALVHRCLGALDRFLDGFGVDGCCAEGLAYWSYGFGYFTAAADLLERATAGMVRIADDPRAVRAAAYGHRVDIGPSRAVTYSDVGPGLPNTAMPVWWARRGVTPISALRPSLASDDPCGRWALLVRTVLWSDPLPGLAADHVDVFDAGTLAVVNGGPYALAIKSGHNDEPHNHLDLGHVSAWLGDDQVLADIGSGVYTAAYFSAGRYGFLHPSARAHNAPRIERAGTVYEQIPGPASRATMTVECDGELRGSAILDLTAAYAAEAAAAVRRTVTWSFGGRGSIVIEDDVAAAGDRRDRVPHSSDATSLRAHGGLARGMARRDPAGAGGGGAHGVPRAHARARRHARHLVAHRDPYAYR